MASAGRPGGQKDDSLYRIPPYFYLHVLDQNTNVTRLEIGPKTYIRQDHERLDLLFQDNSCRCA
jgi:major vault protein